MNYAEQNAVVNYSTYVYLHNELNMQTSTKDLVKQADIINYERAFTEG